MLASARRHRPLAPATPLHREICRSSSSMRRPQKKRQYQWNQPRGSLLSIHPFSSQNAWSCPAFTPYLFVGMYVPTRDVEPLRNAHEPVGGKLAVIDVDEAAEDALFTAARVEVAAAEDARRRSSLLA